MADRRQAQPVRRGPTARSGGAKSRGGRLRSLADVWATHPAQAGNRKRNRPRDREITEWGQGDQAGPLTLRAPRGPQGRRSRVAETREGEGDEFDVAAPETRVTGGTLVCSDATDHPKA